jgi:hypothetical protein
MPLDGLIGHTASCLVLGACCELSQSSGLRSFIPEYNTHSASVLDHHYPRTLIIHSHCHYEPPLYVRQWDITLTRNYALTQTPHHDGDFHVPCTLTCLCSTLTSFIIAIALPSSLQHILNHFLHDLRSNQIPFYLMYRAATMMNNLVPESPEFRIPGHRSNSSKGVPHLFSEGLKRVFSPCRRCSVY